MASSSASSTTRCLAREWSNDKWKFDGRVNYARGEVQNDEKNSTATIFGLPRLIVDYTGSEGAPNFSFPGIDTTNGALVNQIAAVFNPRNNNQEEDGAQFNVEFKPEIDWLPSIKTGVEKRDCHDGKPAARAHDPAQQPYADAGQRRRDDDSCGGAVGDRRHRRQQLGHQRCAVLRYRRSRVSAVASSSGTTTATRLTRRPSPPAASPWIRTDANANPGTNGTFQNYLDTWSVEEETLAGYLQASFVLRQFRRAGERIARCALLRHEHAVGGLQPGAARAR